VTVDHSAMRLGKAPPRHDARTLRMARYLTATLPPAPPAVTYSDKLSAIGMMLNDQLGDCTCAAMGHAVQVWTACNGAEVTVSDADVQAAYVGACGYVPGDPSTDNGGVEIDVLNYFRQTGIGGHKIAAFVALDVKNREHVKLAVDLFGGAYIGVALPNSAKNQDVWSVAISGDQGDITPGSWGGHAIYVVDYDADGITVITWGQKKKATWAWWDVYCDEAYALISQQDWTNGVIGLAPSGIDFAALQADLTAVSA
jgi:hypothetical protein